MSDIIIERNGRCRALSSDLITYKGVQYDLEKVINLMMLQLHISNLLKECLPDNVALKDHEKAYLEREIYD